MSQHLKRKPIEDRLELYLDRMLPDEEAAEVEEAIDHDPALREQVELQQRINSSLRSTYSMPPPVNMEPANTHRTRRVWVAAAVALVALLTGVGYWQYHVNTRATQPRWQTMQAYFDQTVASGFNPQAPDETDAFFANACNERLGQAVMARTLPEESRLLGIDHTHILSTETVVLYAKVNEQPVLVFAERVDATRSAQPMQGNLNRHQKQVGGIMLYEVSRLENPQLLNHFFTSDRKNSPLSQHRRGEAVIIS